MDTGKTVRGILYLCGTLFFVSHLVQGCGRNPPPKSGPPPNTKYCNYAGEDRFSRSDCGYYGIDKPTCEARGCCFENYHLDSYNCFCPNIVPIAFQPTTYTHDELRRFRRTRGVQVDNTYDFDCACKGVELRNSGPGPRQFVVTCTKPNYNQGVCLASTSCTVKNKKTKKKVNVSLPCAPSTKSNTCTYRGNPHCNQYAGNEQRFYAELLNAVGPTQCGHVHDGTCPTGETFNTRRTCSDKTFTCEG